MKKDIFICNYVDLYNVCYEFSSHFFLIVDEYTKETYLISFCEKHKRNHDGYDDMDNETIIKISKEKYTKYSIII